jgi:cytochrome b pre-mRNA-processing protein 3
MFTWLTSRSAGRRKARELYGAVVAQARMPVFYLDHHVADTAEGRYEMVALHLIVLLERMAAPDIGDEELRREVLEAFVVDMDDAMREMGVGDTNVPKKVKWAAAGVYERGVAYRAALASEGTDELVAALVKYVYHGNDGKAYRAAPLASYVRRAVAHVAAEPGGRLQAGAVTFPSPDNP